MDSQRVWTADEAHGYVLGTIVDIGADQLTVQTETKVTKVSYDGVYPVGEDLNKDVDDNCALMFLNEATLLNNIKIRYEKDKIYTYVANILIAINPYFEIKNLYTTDTLKKYQGKSLGVLPPHVFAIGDKAFRDMRALKQSQSIVVSGESGAGKTESTKYILRYLCESVVGGYISHYLLEKSRICGQSLGERNYHIFYQLCAGLPLQLCQKLKLGNPEFFQYLNKGCTQYFASSASDKSIDSERKSEQHKKKGFLSDPIVDDFKNFQSTDNALNHFNVNEADKLLIYKVVAAVLHLGNVCFEESPDDTRGGCRVKSGNSELSLQTAADLLGLDAEELRQSLLSRLMQSKGGYKGTVYLVPLKVYEAQNARDALAKALYSRLFDHIVTKIINKSIPLNGNKYYVGVLDIAGFEYFQSNSFEQFCINYCNEKLQQFFNERILKEEQAIYEKEGLGLKHISFIDNQDCIDLLESKGSGIFDLLDEESKLPKPSAPHFTETVHKVHHGHYRLAFPRKSKLKDHRELRDDEGFLIRHFAGAVCYQTSLFIEKNNDALHGSLESLMSDAKNPLVKDLFYVENQQSLQNGSKASSGKLNFISVGGKFRNQLNELINKLKSNGTHFVRCIKPNLNMVPHKFEGSQIMSQLRCSGMTTVLQLMQQGYPSRALFVDLYNMYKQYLSSKLASLEPRIFCRILFKALGLNENDFRFGSTKVFFRPGKFAEFDQLMKSDPQHLATLISKVEKWLIITRWKRAQWCSLCVIKLKNKLLYRRSKIVTIQKNIRMLLAVKKYRMRYLGLIKLQKLKSLSQEIVDLIPKLKSNEEKLKYSQKMKLIESNIAKLVTDLRNVNQKLTPSEVDTRIKDCDEAINSQIQNLKGKIKEEEALRKMQEAMEIERKQREEEEKKRREEEELKKRKLELEERFKQEQQFHSTKQEELAAVLTLQQQMEKEEQKIRERLQQEKLDYELAVRLASESGSGVNEDYCTSPTPFVVNAPKKEQKKFDLSKWKYSDLRDIINTSCDIELLEACKEEFHRRLKVYHAWKLKNAKSKENISEQRAPDSIMQNASHFTNGTSAKNSENEQRYFRIPFVRASSTTGEKGWWWAHFDGEWIARQMEIHPGKAPILLVAGKDDMQMCELSLDETRLTTKRGAEILEEEFEREWKKNGGELYVTGNRKK
ncbi:unconventional myosin-VI-like protein [Dinothrombium tinctorium]|uniref:Unconventional myosin-VI-like protein n=1 Tax=Dinothrombium tinctorium TaxID=1965070 RepID=A0A3S3NND2_9ACAR|nr:unconventional myosin-VI-like protein [Dinothrombium tinctorium]